MTDPMNRRDALKQIGAGMLAGAAASHLASDASADDAARPTATRTPQRKPAFVHRGSGNGAIRAMISTQKLRDRLKPFVFLDHFDVRSRRPWGFPFHPHSGVATFTYPYTADLDHKDTGGNRGVLRKDGVQWMAAGGGVWHEEYYQPSSGQVEGLQLWLVLPPDMENGPVRYQAADASELPQVGNTKVLAGAFGEARSPVVTPYPFNYFDVKLKPGTTWRFTPPKGHDVAWAYTASGGGNVSGRAVGAGHLVVFDRTEGEVVITAGKQPLRFAFASAKQTPWPVVVGRGSMHTSREALQKGHARIQQIGRSLRRR